MKWIPTNGKDKRYPSERKQIVVKLADGNMTTYQYTGSDISKICLSEQYEFWLDESEQDEGWVPVAKRLAELRPLHIAPYNLGDMGEIDELIHKLAKMLPATKD